MSPYEQQTATAESALNTIEGLEHLFDNDPLPNESATLSSGNAVTYLRVSTTRQMNTAIDLDEDGNSIATQREWAIKKARQLQANVVREFVEPGQSAQTIEKRSEFKKLLRYLDDNPDVKYVIIYMRSRVFRNYTDAAVTKRDLLKRGIRLVSAKEEFGDGYMGDAMEAITDIMNEVQVRMSGEDIRTKLAHKVQRGGTVSRAPIGYLNSRKDIEGRLVNSIDVDPERASLIKWAFEQYATDQYSVWQLASMLEDQGLVSRGSYKRPSRPLAPNSLAKLLRDPYYTGVIRFKGKLYPGKHEAIISKETFLACQEILDRRNRRGDRDIIHFHYLKGMMNCGHCDQAGLKRRLVYSQNTGNGGTYEYWVCSGKQRDGCGIGTLRMDEIEDAIARAVERERLSENDLDRMRAGVNDAIEKHQASERAVTKNLRAELKRLEAQEDRLVDLAADGSITTPKLRERLDYISMQKAAITEKLGRTEDRLHYGAELVLAQIALLSNPGELYKRLPDNVRRDLLGALFSELRVLCRR